ncbi:hypothetical protein LC607_12000 [Nostoc sp. CHAB 5824]|nr:hypothetical protein [Nostoc sp. CHAB 5824]
MRFQRVRKSTSTSSQTPQNNPQLAHRPFGIQAQQVSKMPLTKVEIENQTLQQQKFEATGLEIKQKYGTITPEEQEKLGVLQAKIDDFWVQKKKQTKRQPDLLDILIKNQQRTPITESATTIQPQLSIGQVGDKYEQEADKIATQVVRQIHAPMPNHRIDKSQPDQLGAEVDAIDRRTTKSEPTEVASVTDGIQCKETQVSGDVIQRVSVKEAIKKFEKIAEEQRVDVETAKQQRARKPKAAQVASEPIKAEIETQQLESQPSSSISPESQASDFQPQESQIKFQENKTGKQRWQKLKKIVKTDSSTSQIPGKTKTLSYSDSVGGEPSNENYWLEAWDALHRPAFELGGDHYSGGGKFAKWVEECGIIEWLDEKEQRHKDMRAAFDKQKKDGVADFWKWKETSEYATDSSPPPDIISFWDWLELKMQEEDEMIQQTNSYLGGQSDPEQEEETRQTREKRQERVRYVESKEERKNKEVTISGGQWKDASGDSLSSMDKTALGAPGGGKNWMIFVLSPDGKFYADAHEEGKYHHSSALAGIPVKGAGAIKVIGGTLEEISDKSGHYKPNMHQMYTTLMQLQKCGVDPKTYKVYTRDLVDIQGDQWIQKYLKTPEYEKYRKTQIANAFTMSGRDHRDKKAQQEKRT